MNLSAKIESILYYKGEPIKIKGLSKMLDVKEGEINDAIRELEENLSQRGVRLMRKDDELMLATAPEVSKLIESVRKEELSRDIGKAGRETLSIILYKAPVQRSEIDYIRGVNSAFIIRNLMIRGLIERIDNPNDKRSFLYRPTFELLSFMGVEKVENLQDYEKIKDDLNDFMNENTDEEDVVGKSQEEDVNV